MLPKYGYRRYNPTILSGEIVSEGYKMKLTVIGGGGVRSLFLAKSIAQKAESLRITELVFMDNYEE